MSLSDKLKERQDSQSRLEALERRALDMPYECATDLVLVPLDSGEARAWVYHGSRMLYLIQKRLEARTMEEQYKACMAMVEGYCSKDMRAKVTDYLIKKLSVDDQT